MNRLKIGLSGIYLILTSACCAYSADDTRPQADLGWLAAKTHLTTEVVIPSLSLSGEESDDAIRRVTFRDIQVTAEGGSCKAVFERGGVKFNDFGDGEFSRPPTTESQDVLLRLVSGVDRRREGRRIYAVEFPKEKFLNRVYIVFSPGPVSPDCLLIAGGAGVPQVKEVPDSAPPDRRREQYHSFKRIVPLLSQGQPNLLTAVSRQVTFAGRADNVGMPGIPKQCEISIGGEIGSTGWLINDQNSVSRDAFGEVLMSTLVGYGRKPFILKERKLKDPTSKERKIVDLIATQIPASSDREGPSRLFSLVFDAKSVGADRLLISTDGLLSNVEAFRDTKRERFMQTRRAVASSAADLEVVDRAHELVGSGVDFTIEGGQIVGATVNETGVVPSLLILFPSLQSLKRLQFTNCRNKSFTSDIEFLPQLRNLESLSFYVTPISDPVLVYVGQLPKLKHLRIYDELPRGVLPNSVPHVTDAGLQHLAGLKELTDLSLEGPGITDKGLQSLQSLPKLSDLHLHVTGVTIRGAVEFKKSNSKVHLNMQTRERRNENSNDDRTMTVEFEETRHGAVLKGNLVGDSEIRELVRLTNLQHIRLSGQNEVTERGISELSALSNLETLTFQNVKQMSNQGVSAIAKLQHLKELTLWYSEQVDDQAVPDLGKLTSLSKLETRGTKISEIGRKQLNKLLPNCILDE
jgi:hypothetical protein